MAPLRIASLLAGSTEMLYALGLGGQVVAVSHECDYPPGIADKPRVTRTRVDDRRTSGEIDAQVRAATAQGAGLYEIDADGLRALRPDLIVTQAQCDVCAVRFEDVVSLTRMAPELSDAKIVALNPNRLVDIFGDIVRVARAAGVEEAGHQLAASLRERVDAIRAKVEDLPSAKRPRVVCLEWTEPPMVAANWMPDVLEAAGGRCGLTQAGQHSRYADWVEIVEFDPEVIVVMPCGLKLERAVEESRGLAKRAGWEGLRAVRDRRVFAVDGNAYFNRSGPRIVDSVEMLGGIVHPGLFPDHARAYGFAYQRLST